MNKILIRSFALLLFSSTCYLSAQTIEKLPDDSAMVMTSESTWKSAEALYGAAQALDESGDFEKAKSYYENTIEILRGLQLNDATYKKDLLETRIKTCKLAIAVLEKSLSQSSGASAPSIVKDRMLPSPVSVKLIPPPVIGSQRGQSKTGGRSGSILKEIEQMEKDMIALHEENMNLRKELSNSKTAAQDLTRIKELENLITQKSAEVDGLKANLNFLEARWTRVHEEKIKAETETKSVRVESDLKIKEFEKKNAEKLAQTIKEKEVELRKMSEELIKKLDSERHVMAVTLKENEEKKQSEIASIKKQFEQTLANANTQKNEIVANLENQKKSIEVRLDSEKKLLTEKVNALNEELKKKGELLTQSVESAVAMEKLNLTKVMNEKITALENERNLVSSKMTEIINNFEAEKKALLLSVETLKTQNESLVNKVKEFEAGLVALTQEKTAQLEKITTLETEKKATETELQTLKTGNEPLINKVKEFEAVLATLTQEKTAQLEKITTLETEKKATETELQTLKIGNEPLINKIKEVENELSKLGQEKATFIQLLTTLKAEKEQEKATFSTLTKELATKHQALVNELVTKTEASEKLIQENKELAERASKLMKESVSPEEFHRKQRAIEDLMKENQSLKEEVLKYKPASM